MRLVALFALLLALPGCISPKLAPESVKPKSVPVMTQLPGTVGVRVAKDLLVTSPWSGTENVLAAADLAALIADTAQRSNLAVATTPLSTTDRPDYELTADLSGTLDGTVTMNAVVRGEWQLIRTADRSQLARYSLDSKASKTAGDSLIGGERLRAAVRAAVAEHVESAISILGNPNSEPALAAAKRAKPMLSTERVIEAFEKKPDELLFRFEQDDAFFVARDAAKFVVRARRVHAGQPVKVVVASAFVSRSPDGKKAYTNLNYTFHEVSGAQGSTLSAAPFKNAKNLSGADDVLFAVFEAKPGAELEALRAMRAGTSPFGRKLSENMVTKIKF